MDFGCAKKLYSRVALPTKYNRSRLSTVGRAHPTSAETHYVFLDKMGYRQLSFLITVGVLAYYKQYRFIRKANFKGIINSIKIFFLSASELVNEFINSLIFLYRLVEVKIFIA